MPSEANTKQPIHLVYAADGRFAMPLAVSLHSALRHLRPGLNVELYIVDGGFTAQQRQRVRQVAERAAGRRSLQWHWVNPSPHWWRGVELDFSHSSLNITTLYRLGMPSFLPADVDRAIYLDADTLIKDDVSQMLEPLDPATGAAAAPDYSFITWAKRYADRPQALASFGIEPHQPYFNAGALAVNLAYWREHNVVHTTARFLRDYAHLAWLADQDGLNYALVGRWHALPLAWNFHPTCRDTISRRGSNVQRQLGQTFEQLHAEAKLVHFTGAKPWNQGFTNPERPAFVAELKASRWFSPLGYRWWAACYGARLVRRGVWKFIYWRWLARRRSPGAVEATSPGASAAATQ
jgi:lipopolysaccharide biosynthesis glycosyltransferase